MTHGTGAIMVVDDTVANLKLLDGLLRERGYQVVAFPRGDLALKGASKKPPDLILLDINMPEMDGYEVCERLKADEALKDIPVIFISALTETMDKVKAFSVGGVDYVTKPFQFEEVEARVHTHLELQRQKRAVRESYERLRELEHLRDSLVHMIVHDMRSPLTGIQGFLQLLELQTLPDKATGYVQQAAGSTSALIEMVSSLLDVSKMESGQMKLNLVECDLVAVAREVLTKLDSMKGNRALLLETPTSVVTVIADPELLSRIIQNLLGNALKFTPDDGEIHIGIALDEERVRVSVRDTGPCIPPEYHEKIFEKFGQVELRENKQKYSTGLGLTFCKMAVEAHGGKIGVDSQVGEGSTFWFELPKAPAAG